MRERLALSVAESDARHRALLAALPDGVLLQDLDGTVLLANVRACELLGIESPDAPLLPQGVVPRPRSDAGDAIGRVSEATAVAVRTGRNQDGVTVTVTRDGADRRLRLSAVPLLADDGRPQAVASTFREAPDDATPAAIPDASPARTDEATGTAGPGADPGANSAANPDAIPRARQDDEHRRRGDELFRRTMQHSPIGMAVTALNGRFLRVNRTLCRMLGYRADELQKRTLYQILHAADLEETSLAIGTLIHGDVDVVSLERRYVGQGDMPLRGPLSVTLVRDAQARPLHFVVQVQDGSEVHRAQELLTHLTLHDPLTGLANRTLVLDRIREALARGRPGGPGIAVLQCDVDHFRVVNDSAGHEAGDAVLIELGRRIARSLRPGDTAGRLGGDEFVVVCAEVADEREAVTVAERLQRSVGAPLAVGRRTIAPRISVGIALGSSDADPRDLLRDADLATRRAKHRGRDRWDLVDGGLRDRAVARMEVEHELRAGLGAGELELHFQPIVDLGTRAVVGREALLRWNHPDRGQLAPMLFLPVAEESGLIVDVGAWVLAEAARVAAAAPESSGYVAVNVSPNQVTRPGLADAVRATLADAGLPPERLVIELTESVMLSAAPGARQEIERLDALGVRIVVDDFGTGFSALSYLRDLPVSGIKVDRSFTAGLGSDPQCDRIVEALTGLAHGLDVDVVVEGVETERQRELLASIGAEHAQGYLFGRPSPEYCPAPS